MSTKHSTQELKGMLIGLVVVSGKGSYLALYIEMIVCLLLLGLSWKPHQLLNPSPDGRITIRMWYSHLPDSDVRREINPNLRIGLHKIVPEVVSSRSRISDWIRINRTYPWKVPLINEPSQRKQRRSHLVHVHHFFPPESLTLSNWKTPIRGKFLMIILSSLKGGWCALRYWYIFVNVPFFNIDVLSIKYFIKTDVIFFTHMHNTGCLCFMVTKIRKYQYPLGQNQPFFLPCITWSMIHNETFCKICIFWNQTVFRRSEETVITYHLVISQVESCRRHCLNVFMFTYVLAREWCNTWSYLWND